MIIEWDADCVDDYGGIPEPGDIVEGPKGRERLVTRVSVVNKSKVQMKANPKKGVSYHDDISDPSNNWEDIDDKYLNNHDTNFLNSGLSPK